VNRVRRLREIRSSSRGDPGGAPVREQGEPLARGGLGLKRSTLQSKMAKLGTVIARRSAMRDDDHRAGANDALPKRGFAAAVA